MESLLSHFKEIPTFELDEENLILEVSHHSVSFIEIEERPSPYDLAYAEVYVLERGYLILPETYTCEVEYDPYNVEDNVYITFKVMKIPSWLMK